MQGLLSKDPLQSDLSGPILEVFFLDIHPFF